MERIVIEVSKVTAKKWRAANAPKKKKLISLLAHALNEQSQPLEERTSKTIAHIEAGLSEASLSKEWLSPEDKRWDELLK
jgi:hypothetical protein